MSFTGSVFVGELSIAIKIIHAKDSGGFWASSPLYLRLRTFNITLTIFSESFAPRLLNDSEAFPPPLPSEPNLPTFGFLSLVPVRLCLCGEPVSAVHIELRTPGLCSQPRFVSSLSADTANVWAVALAVMVSPTVDLPGGGEQSIPALPGLRHKVSCGLVDVGLAEGGRLWAAASIFMLHVILSRFLLVVSKRTASLNRVIDGVLEDVRRSGATLSGFSLCWGEVGRLKEVLMS